MDKYIQKIKSLLNKAPTGPDSYDRKSIQPIHDWSILLSFTTIGLLCSGLLAYYFYYEIKNGKFFDTAIEQAEDEKSINMKLLNKAIEDIDTREKEARV